MYNFQVFVHEKNLKRIRLKTRNRKFTWKGWYVPVDHEKKLYLNSDLCYVLNKCCSVPGYAFRLGYIHKSALNFNEFKSAIKNYLVYDMPKIIFEKRIKISNGHYFEIAVKIITHNKPCEEKCWTDVTLITPSGKKISCTQQNKKFTGIYNIEFGESNYVLEILEECDV